MKVAVQGLWHLGTVTAAALASVGHDVVGLDFDAGVVRSLNEGTPPIQEPGLTELVAAGLASGRLRFTSDAAQLPRDLDLLWVTYDTPVDDDDVADVEWVMTEIERTLASLPLQTTVLISSQLPVGSTRRLAARAAAIVPDGQLSFASSPENLRLGKALEVFLRPDRVVVGVTSESDRNRIATVFAPITDRIEWMSVESAEMTKHAVNAFLATSVVFANEIAAICEAVGADAKEVERGLKSEQRIGPKAYVSPGGAFAGGTLARDIAYLREIGEQNGVIVQMMGAVKQSNDHHKGWIKRRLERLFPSLSGLRVAVWGLTYKAGTDTLRRSLAVELCNWLLENGAELRVYDARVRELPPGWSGRVQRFEDPLEAACTAQVLLIGTETPELRDVDFTQLAQATPLVVLDANRYLSAVQSMPGIHYVSVGSPR